MIHCVVGELADRNNGASLMIRKKDEAGRHRAATDAHYNAVDADDIVRAARLVEDGLLGFCPRS